MKSEDEISAMNNIGTTHHDVKPQTSIWSRTVFTHTQKKLQRGQV